MRLYVFNVDTGKAVSFNQLPSMLNDALGTPIKPKYALNPIKNYVWHTFTDTKKVEGVLGFKAQMDLKTDISVMLGELRDSRSSTIASLLPSASVY